ncbi:MAG TPA: hypothetical protein VE978_07135 [Chitinophagales bacterium]|nr:hypothetical protein [Chitinophagales bacterium]
MKLFRIFIFQIVFVTAVLSVQAQTFISEKNLQLLNHYQDTLKVLSDSMLDSKDEMKRQGSCYQFIRTMVRALKVEGSFHFPFDALERISILAPDDQSFRILNWVLPFDDSTYRYYGTIQMNDLKQLKLFPLFDYSEFISKPADTLTNNEHWFGALYYRMLEVKSSGGKPYYLLFGWDGNDAHSHKKLIDVLSFNSKKQPVFGASLFDFGSYDPRNKIKRFILEYKETAQVSIRYDDELQMIVYDHLEPESPLTKDDYTTYVPDGSYEGFKWENGKWHHVENVFTTTQKEPPFPDPVDFGKQKKIYTPPK